jgi:retron-type reverse transcriptase
MVAQASAASHDDDPQAEAEPDKVRRKRTPEEIVSQLQARIVKAQEAGHYNKVKALQRTLAHSHSAKVLAVERVSTNDGSKTPGVDGIT